MPKKPKKKTGARPAPPSGPAVEIDRLLQAVTAGGTGRVTKETLQQHLEVTRSTVKRDFDLMRDLFAPPIDYDARRRTLYYTRPFTLRPPIWLEPDESLGLLTAIRFASQSRVFPMGPGVVRALRKIAPSVKDGDLIDPDTLGAVFSTADSAASEAEAEHFLQLCTAITDRLAVHIAYKKAKHRSEQETRSIHPLHWFICPDACLLIAHDPKIAKRRTFELRRIQSVEVTDDTFGPPAGYDLARILSGAFGHFVGEPEVDVLVRFDRDYVPLVREREWQATQLLVELSDGRAEATYHVCHTAELEQYVLRAGGQAEVVSPPEVRARVRAAAERLLARHG